MLRALAPDPLTLTDPTYALRPDLPVGGRLTHFLPFWEKLTSDDWVLGIIRRGYRMELIKTPPFSGVRVTPLRNGGSVLLEEMGDLRAKSAVEPVPLGQKGIGFYSTYFTVPKKDGGIRPILNLKPFNQFLRKRKFKMETLQTIISIMQPGAWLASVDLKDAYFHVPIAREFRKFLRFQINGVALQYKVTPFGLSPAPLLFTKVVLILIAWLRSRGVQLHAYLDDFLIVGTSPQATLDALSLTIQVLTCAGFILNVKKSDLTPTQDLVFIGGRFKTAEGTVFLPEDRRVALIRVVHSFLKPGVLFRVRAWLQLLGFMAATIPLVQYAHLRMRPIQWFVKEALKKAPIEDRWTDFDFPICVKRTLLPALIWWTRTDNLSRGMPYQAPAHDFTVTTDASMEGWGGHMTVQGRDLLFSGDWSVPERQLHINVLELRAIRLTLMQLTSSLTGKTVLIECDNTSAVCYLNKQGGTLSWSLTWETHLLYQWAMKYSVQLRAIHRPGVDNTLADYLSRNRPDPLEWSLSTRVCDELFRQWGKPQIDLFASPENHQLPLWFSRHAHPDAIGTDALSHSWRGYNVYAFPPFNLILKTVLKLENEQVREAIVVTPNWTRQDWYPILLRLACEPPTKLRKELGLLSQKIQNRGTLFHPDLETLHLVAWRLNV